MRYGEVIFEDTINSVTLSTVTSRTSGNLHLSVSVALAVLFCVPSLTCHCFLMKGRQGPAGDPAKGVRDTFRVI